MPSVKNAEREVDTASEDITTGYNSTYTKGGVSCFKDSFVVKQTLVFQIKFCGKSPALRVAAKRYPQVENQPHILALSVFSNPQIQCSKNQKS